MDVGGTGSGKVQFTYFSCQNGNTDWLYLNLVNRVPWRGGWEVSLRLTSCQKEQSPSTTRHPYQLQVCFHNQLFTSQSRAQMQHLPSYWAISPSCFNLLPVNVLLRVSTVSVILLWCWDTARVGSWVIHYSYQSAHKDKWQGSVCVCVWGEGGVKLLRGCETGTKCSEAAVVQTPLTPI